MPSSEDTFAHHIAIELSRRLNLVNPNDLLAKRVIDIARHNHSGDAFVKAASTFGKFDREFLLSLHSEILANLSLASGTERRASHGSPNEANTKLGGDSTDGGVTHEERDIQPADAPRRGGLYSAAGSDHTFKAPKQEVRASLLGLDKLAAQKRAEEAARNGNGSKNGMGPPSKRQRLDADDVTDQDGNLASGGVFKVPILPVRSKEHIRARAPETPSHPGGISSAARAKMEERLRARGQGSNIPSAAPVKADSRHLPVRQQAQQGLGDFQQRLNKGKNREPEPFERSRPGQSKSWQDAPTPRTTTSRRDRDGEGSLRVPNRGWDETPRSSRGGDEHSGWGLGGKHRSGGGRTWDAATPRRQGEGGDSPNGGGGDSFVVDSQEWEEEQVRLDRDWYGNYDENAVAGDEENNPFAGYEDLGREAEKQMEAKQQKRLSAKQMQYNADNEAWENNRMQTSGVATRQEVNMDFDDDSGTRVHVLVHDIKPPFLDGRTAYTRQLDPISPIRDPTSDMAVFSRKGSALVRERREQQERAKAAARLASESGTTLGNLSGIKGEPELGKEGRDGVDESNYKADSQFASHMKKAEGASNFSRTRTLKQQREYLPAFAVRDELMRTIRENQVTIVVGETGSGKTTQLAQFLYEDGYCAHGMIGCTQPRRVAAMSVAKRVSEEMECDLGGTVGYAIRFEDCTSKQTKIKYMTDGVLLRESLNEGDLDRYQVIILDEAHERSLSTDVLMGLLRKILTRRRDLKLIVTSATMNAEKFSNFYGLAPTFTIPGRTFPVEIFHSKSPCEDYVDSAIKQVLQIHLSNPPGDILVFMTGQEDIEVTCSVIQGE